MKDRKKAHTPLEGADAFVRARLSEKRYEHTLGVAATAEDLARAHCLDTDRACLAALLHDAAREIGDPEKFLRLAKEWNIPVGEPEREAPQLLHGPVAAELARQELGVEDADVLEAIRVHTVGRPGMGPLALVLYVADKIEPAREYPSVERLRGLSRDNLWKAAAESLRRSIAHNEQRGRPTHPASRRTLAWLEAEHAPQVRVE